MQTSTVSPTLAESARQSTDEPTSPSPSSTQRRSRRFAYSDRYIPSRSVTDIHANFTLRKAERSREGPAAEESSENREAEATYTFVLKNGLFGDSSPNSPYRGSLEWGSDVTSPKRSSGDYSSGNIFKFYSNDSPRSGSGARGSNGSCSSASNGGGFGLGDGLSTSESQQQMLLHVQSNAQRLKRRISRAPYKVLDAPSLQDDFYLNLVDWSSTNMLAVGLQAGVYLWSANTSKVTNVDNLGYNVSSVGWSLHGKELAVGKVNGDVLIYDAGSLSLVRTLRGHRARVGCLAWNASVLSTGSRDRKILNRDLRCPNDVVNRLTGHCQEVCGLKWSPDESELASGGNENKLLVWNLRHSAPSLTCNAHEAAVKAIAWSPHQRGLLASGGGTADNHIRFWNTVKGTHVNCIDTGSQVCNLAWSYNVNEFVSTHGYSQNQIVLWRYPRLSKVAVLTGHTTRVLYMSMSPTGENIVTGAGDETLRFWNVFPGPAGSATHEGINALSPERQSIR